MLPVLLAAAVAFPQAISPPRQVSPVTWTAPVFAQSYPVVASNGSMSFVAWSDMRSSSRFALGTRLAPDGTPLDPRGITIPEIGLPETVTWTGDAFAVIGKTITGRAVVFVGPDASVSAPLALDLPAQYWFAAVSSSGQNARLLYLRSDANATLNGQILSPRGELLVKFSLTLSAQLTAPNLGARWMATGRQHDFAIIGPSATTLIDRDGRLVANTAASWPFDYFFTDNIAIAGEEGHGFMLVRQKAFYFYDPAVVVCALDEKAAFAGKSAVIPLPWFWHLAQDHPAIAWVNDSYVMVNQGAYGDNTAHTYVSPIDADLHARTKEVKSAGAPILLTIQSGQTLLLAGSPLNAQIFSASLEAQDPHHLNLSATVQSNVAVAASSHGYAVAWMERAADATRTYIRRYSSTGEPLDAAAIEASRAQGVPFRDPVLTATDDVYVVDGRRMNAASGEWIGGAVSANIIAAASNGRDALLVVRDSHGLFALQQMPSFAFEPSAAVPLPTTTQPIGSVALASNGRDYLAVWSTTYPCYTLCPHIATTVYALRVRSDGSWIDSAPTQLAPDGTLPSVVWAGDSYIASWYIFGDSIRAARIAADGALLIGAGGGVVVEAWDARVETVSDYKLVPFEQDVILFERHAERSGEVFWTAARVRPTDLATAAAAPRAKVGADGGSLGASSLFGRLMIAFDKSFDSAAGGVSRVYTQLLEGLIARRRSIAH
jgi:hypothetical protein